MKWFDESKGNAKSFDCWFTRQESRRFLHNFMYMISATEGENDSTQVSMKLHIFAFAILCLRNAISLYSRFSIDEAQLTELDKECSNVAYTKSRNISNDKKTTTFDVDCIMHREDTLFNPVLVKRKKKRSSRQ